MRQIWANNRGKNRSCKASLTRRSASHSWVWRLQHTVRRHCVLQGAVFSMRAEELVDILNELFGRFDQLAQINAFIIKLLNLCDVAFFAFIIIRSVIVRVARWFPSVSHVVAVSRATRRPLFHSLLHGIIQYDPPSSRLVLPSTSTSVSVKLLCFQCRFFHGFHRFIYATRYQLVCDTSGDSQLSLTVFVLFLPMLTSEPRFIHWRVCTGSMVVDSRCYSFSCSFRFYYYWNVFSKFIGIFLSSKRMASATEMSSPCASVEILCCPSSWFLSATLMESNGMQNSTFGNGLAAWAAGRMARLISVRLRGSTPDFLLRFT